MNVREYSLSELTSIEVDINVTATPLAEVARLATKQGSTVWALNRVLWMVVIPRTEAALWIGLLTAMGHTIERTDDVDTGRYEGPRGDVDIVWTAADSAGLYWIERDEASVVGGDRRTEGAVAMTGATA